MFRPQLINNRFSSQISSFLNLSFATIASRFGFAACGGR